MAFTIVLEYGYAAIGEGSGGEEIARTEAFEEPLLGATKNDDCGVGDVLFVEDLLVMNRENDAAVEHLNRTGRRRRECAKAT